MPGPTQTGPTRRAELGLLEWLRRHRGRGLVRLPSERALAAEFGVSFYAVNRAVAEMVARGVLRREGYKLYPGRTDDPISAPLTIGALRITEFHSLGIAELAEQARARVVWGQWIDQATARRELRRLAQAGIDGLLFWPPGVPWTLERDVRQVEERGIPVVLVNATPPGHHSVDWSVWNTVRLTLDHLASLGHRRIALVHGSANQEHYDAWIGMCFARGLLESASLAVELPGGPDERRAEIVVAWLAEAAPQCTAALVTLPTIAPVLQRLLAEHGRRVPRDFSIVTMGDTPATRTASPPISSVAGEHRLLNRAAWDLLLRLIQDWRRTQRRPGPQRVRLELDLRVRGSTGPAPGFALSPEAAAWAVPSANRELRWSAEERHRLEEVEQINGRPYLSAKGLALRDFAPLDLRPLLNRPIGYRRGWLGDQPLEHLPPGVRVFHGVPFEIRGGPRRNDFGVLVLRSQHSHVTGGREAPTQVELELPPLCRAVYFLHACAFGRSSRVFARYTFVYADGRHAQVPLRPLGDGVPVGGGDEGVAPNLQDWWPDVPQQDFPHAHRVVVTENGDPALYERYLYTLEWINPRPRARLRRLRIAADPTAEPTLGVLAITALPG